MNDVQSRGVILDPLTYPKIGLHLCTFPYHTANTVFYSKNWIQLNSGKGLKSCHWYPSARLMTFFLQLELFFQLENLIHSFFSSNFLFSPPKLVIYNRIEWKLCCFFLEWLIFGVKKENWRKKKLYIKEKIQLVFSSKMKVLLLGSAPSKLGLARAGKIQLELITTTYH